MFAKKTKIISLLLAVVLLLCPLQAASAETQMTPEEKIKRLLPVIERNPDGRFGIFVALDIDEDEIKRQAEKAWGKEIDTTANRFTDEGSKFHYFFKKSVFEKTQSDFMAKVGLTEQDRIIKLWWAEGVFVMVNKEQIYRMAQMDEVQYFEYYWPDPIKTRVEKFTCEHALKILQLAVGVSNSIDLGYVYDLDLDGTIDVSDALKALQSAVGLRTVYVPDPLPFGWDYFE